MEDGAIENLDILLGTGLIGAENRKKRRDGDEAS